MSTRFNAKQFCSEPSLDKLQDKVISKDDWKFVAYYFDIAYESSDTKERLKNIVMQELSNRNILPEGAVAASIPLNHSDSDSQLSDEALKAHEHKPHPESWSEARLEFEREKFQLELQEKQKAYQIEYFKLELQKRELEEKEKDRQIELAKIRQLEESTKLKEEELKLQKEKSFNLGKSITLVPTFEESDPEKSFATFEKTAIHLKWPKAEWPWLLQPKLVGKAQKTFNHLDNTEDYDMVKQAILDAYEITPDHYRRTFRNYVKPDKHTFLEFAMEKMRMLKKWLATSNITTFSDLVNLVAIEEWKRRLPLNIYMYIEEKGEGNLTKAAQLADSYALIHRGLQNRDKQKPPHVRFSSSYNPVSEVAHPAGVPKRPNYNPGKREEICSYCKYPGHNILQCTHPKCRTSSTYKLTLSSSQKPPAKSEKPVTNIYTHSSTSDPFSAFKVPGTVSISDNTKTYPITILRDTGSAQSLLCKKALPSVEHNYTGEKVALKSLNCSPTADLANIHIQSELIRGPVKVAVLEMDLPVPGVTFLLGNDLAGRGMIPDLVVKEKPMSGSPTEKLDQEKPHIFPVCAVTRSQTASKTSSSPSLPGRDDMLTQVMCRENLIKAQEEDSSLARLRHIADDKPVNGKNPNIYYKQGVLMRCYHPFDRPDSATWSTIHQVIIPSSIRSSVMELAHEGISGHLGQKNTYRKLFNHFYWPNIKNDVREFVKSCHTCQLVGKPNETIPRAPLTPIPVPTEPFEKIVIDCVGPLPKTKKGNQYLLTVMCAATRYPEAYPLRDIKAKNIVSHLLHLFTKVGIPQEIQSDQGSNFTSDLMKSVMLELEVNKKVATAYRPQTQGCLERHHQTLKSMIKKFCFQTGKEWDTNIDWLLFAIRECPQESLGYSPFEMLYGRQIRGPLKVLKDSWFTEVSDHPSRTVQEYINTLKLTLSKVRELALANLEDSQKKMKSRYDVKSKSRAFDPGDKVLLFLPIPGHALKSKYSGPYIVSQRLTNLNYVVHTPDRKRDQRLVHVNQMKAYIERPLEENTPVLTLDTVPFVAITEPKVLENKENNEETEFVDFPTPSGNPKNSEILQNLNQYLSGLSLTQRGDLRKLLGKFPSVLSDVPGFCTTHVHDVILKSAEIAPIKQSPYRLNPQKQDIMKKELDYMLENSLIEPSYSPWASPSLLVPKPDGSSRLCTDYRKVNSVTVPDAYPLPRIDDLIDTVGAAKLVTTIDLQKGYYQIGMTDRAKTISAFTTPFGLFQYLVMPFGMMNAPATFQRAISCTVQNLVGVQTYLDDLVITSDMWEDHLSRLECLLERLAATGFTINLAKSCFGRGTVTYLGHVVGQGMARPKEINVEAISSFPRPGDRKSLMRFLGMCGFYRRFCPNFAAVSAPLTDLTSPKKKFIWTPTCTEAFNKMKGLLSSHPVLHSPDPTLPYHLQVDASDRGVGAILLQPDKETGVLHPVSYYSAKLNKHQRNYATVEKELLALVSAVRKFQCYLPQHYPPITVHTDHNPLTFLHKMKNTNQRLLRWALNLQEYHLTIKHIRGVDNLIADALSRDLPPSAETLSPSK